MSTGLLAPCALNHGVLAVAEAAHVRHLLFARLFAAAFVVGEAYRFAVRRLELPVVVVVGRALSFNGLFLGFCPRV